jgi:hypothetical protein
MPQNVPGMQQQTRLTTAMTPPSGRVGAPASTIQTAQVPFGSNQPSDPIGVAAAAMPNMPAQSEGMKPPEGRAAAADEPDEETKKQTRSKMPGHANFLQFQKRLAERIGTDLGTNPQPAQSPEIDDLEPGDPGRILDWARQTNYDVKDPVSPRMLTEFITGRKPPRPGQKPMGPRADRASAQRANTGASPAKQRASNIPMPPGAQPPGDRPGEDASMGPINTGGPAYQNMPMGPGVAGNVPMAQPAPSTNTGGAFRSPEEIESYRRRPEAARGGEPSQGPSRATGSATDRARQEIRVNREQADRPGGFTAPGETVGQLPEGTNYMRWLAEESFTGDMADKAAEVRGGPPRGGTPSPPPSARTGGALPEQQGGDMSAAAQDQDQADGPQRIPQIPGGGQGGAFTTGAPTAGGMPLPGVQGTMADLPAQGGQRAQPQPAQGGGQQRTGGGQQGDATTQAPAGPSGGTVDTMGRTGAVAPGGMNTGGRAGPATQPSREGPGGSQVPGIEQGSGTNPMTDALIQRSPTFRKMTEDPAGTMESAGFNVNETFNKLMKEIGREPEEASLDEDQKARLMMEMGLRMMTQSGKPGATFLGAIGNAGLNTMQTAQAMKQQDRKQKQRASERRQQALQTRLDVGLQREEMQAEAARARQERLFEARENALDRMTELEKERLQNRYGGEDAPKIAQLTQFYEENIPGISREEAINRAEATGSASPANIRAQAISDFNDVRNEAPEFLRNEYGWERGKNDAEVRQQYVNDIVNLVQGGAGGGGQQQGGSGAPPSNVLSWARQQEGAQRVRRQNGQWGAVTSDGEFIPYQE